MTYAKPSITRAAKQLKRSAMTTLCSKSSAVMESTDPHRMTPPAYSADEE